MNHCPQSRPNYDTSTHSTADNWLPKRCVGFGGLTRSKSEMSPSAVCVFGDAQKHFAVLTYPQSRTQRCTVRIAWSQSTGSMRDFITKHRQGNFVLLFLDLPNLAWFALFPFVNVQTHIAADDVAFVVFVVRAPRQRYYRNVTQVCQLSFASMDTISGAFRVGFTEKLQWCAKLVDVFIAENEINPQMQVRAHIFDAHIICTNFWAKNPSTLKLTKR